MGHGEPASAEPASTAAASTAAATAAGPGSRDDARLTVRSETAIAGLSLDDVEFHALRAIRYHEARRRTLDLRRRWLDFLVVVGGAGATTSLIGSAGGIAAGIGLVLAAIGGLQLVAGFGERAQEHEWLRRRFCEVLARVTEVKTSGGGDRDDLVGLAKRLAAIWSEEPPTMHVVEAIAHNAAERALRRDVLEDDLIEIGPWQRFTRNVSSWESFEPLTRREKRKRRENV